MKSKLLRGLCIVLICTLVFSINASARTPKEMSLSLTAWLKANVTVSQAEGKIDSYLDWTVFALARNGDAHYARDYKNYIAKAVAASYNTLSLSDCARICLAVCSLGMNPENIGNKNLVDAVLKTDFSKEAFTGSLAYGLIALNAAQSSNTAVIQNLVNLLLGCQRKDGGYNAYVLADNTQYWTLEGETDSTGIVLQALAPFRAQKEVEAATQKALAFLHAVQMDDGGFGAWGAGSAESTSMVLAGLCEMGENPHTFCKNGKSPVDALSAYLNPDGGGRCWDSSSNIMTSYQMLLGLASYDRLQKGLVGLYDMHCLSPYCNSIEHLPFFEIHPILGKIICRIISNVYGWMGKDYFCCKH